MSELTDKQKRALEDAGRQIKAITCTDLGDWHIAYAPETRPGRGHDITAWAADGEHMATQYLDPYGSGPLVVSSIRVLHNDAEEDHFNDEGKCDCYESDTE